MKFLHFLAFEGSLAFFLSGFLTCFFIIGVVALIRNRLRSRPRKVLDVNALTRRPVKLANSATRPVKDWRKDKEKHPELRGTPGLEKELADHGREYLFAKPQIEPFNPEMTQYDIRRK